MSNLSSLFNDPAAEAPLDTTSANPKDSAKKKTSASGSGPSYLDAVGDADKKGSHTSAPSAPSAPASTPVAAQRVVMATPAQGGVELQTISEDSAKQVKFHVEQDEAKVEILAIQEQLKDFTALELMNPDINQINAMSIASKTLNAMTFRSFVDPMQQRPALCFYTQKNGASHANRRAEPHFHEEVVGEDETQPLRQKDFEAEQDSAAATDSAQNKFGTAQST